MGNPFADPFPSHSLPAKPVKPSKRSWDSFSGSGLTIAGIIAAIGVILVPILLMSPAV